MSQIREIAVVGTDTGVGKTHVVSALVQAMRQAGRRVWIHKPIACGDWSCGQAEDPRRLAPWCADGQPPATLCPFQFPEPASPHLAAAAAGRSVSLDELRVGLAAVRGDHDLLVEGAGGLLTPLTSERSTIADLLVGTGIPLLIVARPDLGTLNHTALTVDCARRRGLSILGLVVNRVRPVPASLATDTAVAELTACTGVPVLADLPFRPHGGEEGPALAALVAQVLGGHDTRHR